jgi:rod shape determining protein RodA
MIEQSRFSRFDFPLFWSAIALWVVGIFLVFSATYTNETGPLVGIYKKQIFWVIMAVVIIVATTSIPGRFFSGFGYVFYGLSLFLLVIAIVMGTEAKGAERWVSIGGLKLQPSEFAKIGLMLALARYLSKRSLSFDRLQSFIMPSIHRIVRNGGPHVLLGRIVAYRGFYSGVSRHIPGAVRDTAHHRIYQR